VDEEETDASMEPLVANERRETKSEAQITMDDPCSAEMLSVTEDNPPARQNYGCPKWPLT